MAHRERKIDSYKEEETEKGQEKIKWASDHCVRKWDDEANRERVIAGERRYPVVRALRQAEQQREAYLFILNT